MLPVIGCAPWLNPQSLLLASARKGRPGPEASERRDGEWGNLLDALVVIGGGLTEWWVMGACLASQAMHTAMCNLQELALEERKSLLEAVWQSREGPAGDAVYSRDALLGSMHLDWQDVQWAVNIVRSRCVITMCVEVTALLGRIYTTGLSTCLMPRAEVQGVAIGSQCPGGFS